MSFELIEESFCKCIFQPMGDYGLEGYQKNNTYRAQIMLNTQTRQKYVRVYPDNSFPDYYETCSTRNFKDYFAMINIEDHSNTH
jgi:hypothetical protein